MADKNYGQAGVYDQFGFHSKESEPKPAVINNAEKALICLFSFILIIALVCLLTGTILAQ